MPNDTRKSLLPTELKLGAVQGASDVFLIPRLYQKIIGITVAVVTVRTLVRKKKTPLVPLLRKCGKLTKYFWKSKKK